MWMDDDITETWHLPGDRQNTLVYLVGQDQYIEMSTCTKQYTHTVTSVRIMDYITDKSR